MDNAEKTGQSADSATENRIIDPMLPSVGLRRVLAVRYSAIGDVAIAIPVLYSACACHPDVRFVMLTRSSLTSMWVNRPANLEVIGIDESSYRGLGGAKRLMRLLGEEPFSVVIDLQNDKATRALRLYCWLHHIHTVKFNNAQSHKHDLSRRTNKVMLPLASSRARYREAFFKAGLPIDGHFNGLFGLHGKGDPKDFASVCAPKPPKPHKWVGIAPFALYPEKEYPLEKMEEVIKSLAELPDTTIFILGGAGREEQKALEWAQKYPPVISMAGGHHHFNAELALMSHFDVLVTMDSVNMQLGSIANTPTISIWGATHHYCGSKGWHQSETDMIQLPLPCRPCSMVGDKPCYRHDRLCLTAIRPDMIYSRIVEKLT